MKFKRILSLLASAAMTISALCGAMSITASAADSSGECGDGVEFSWVESTKTLTFSYTGEGSGEIADFDTAANKSPWNSYAIEKVVVGEGITRLGDYFISNRKTVTSISLPSTLKSIGSAAFMNAFKTTSNVEVDLTTCTSLETITENAFLGSNVKSIKLPDSLKVISNSTFSTCSQLTDITLGNAVESIGTYVFRNCTSLESIEIPNSVTKLGNGAFDTCSSLQSVKLSTKLDAIGEATFNGCKKLASIEIPASVKTIGLNAFSGCSDLLSLTTNEGLTEIGEKAFYNCSKLANVSKFPNSLTTIGNNAFQGCIAIPNVDFLDTEGSITLGNNVFQGCNGITTVSFPKSVKTIGNNVFQSCSGITEVTIPSTVEKFGSHIFNSCSNLNKATFLSGVTSIPQYLFASCTNLETVVKANTVTSINDYAFSGCSSLTSFNFAGVTTIGGYAFEKTGFETVAIPANVKSIGGFAFKNCSKLTSVSLSNGVTTIGGGAFSSTKIKTVVIPASVTELGGAFSDCSELTTVTFSGTSKITKIGDSLFQGCKLLTDFEIPKSVTEIGSTAFKNCAAITEITIPNGVTKIGYGAFNGCNGLTSVIIPGSVQEIGGTSATQGVFYQCTNLETVTFESGAKVIGGGMFANDTSLKNVSIPYSVESVGNAAFQGCKAITNINLANISEIGPNAFKNCTGLTSIQIPKGTVGNNAFDGCQNLASIDFGEDVTSIGNSTFNNCTNLKSVTLPKNLEKLTIGSNSSFKGCTALTDINVPEGGTNYSSSNGVLFNADKTKLVLCPVGKTGSYTIPSGTIEVSDSAFYNCTNLKSVSYASTLTTIGGSAFYGCTGLTSGGTLPSTLESLGDRAFYNCSSLASAKIPSSLGKVPQYVFNGCSALKTVEIEDGITLIDDYSFNSTGLTSVTIPDSVTSIDSSAFASCSNLKTVKLSENLERIDSWAFQNSGITSISIPSSVTSLGMNAFQNCTSLETIKFADDITSFGTFASSLLQGCTSLKSVTIPEGVNTLPASMFNNCSNEALVIDIMGLKESELTASNVFNGVKGTINVYDQRTYDNVKAQVKSPAKLVMAVDFTNLNKAIERARAVVGTDYTSGSYASVASNLTLAEYIVSQKSASSQSSADSIAKALNKAIDGLAPLKDLTVFEALQDTIKNADALVESDYGKDSYAVLASAIEAAKVITEDALISEMNDAKKAIEDAVDALVPVYLSPDISLNKEIYPYDNTITIDDLTDDLTTLIAEGVADESMAGATQIRFTFDDGSAYVNFSKFCEILFRAIIGERDGETEPVVIKNNVKGSGENALANSGLTHTVTLNLENPINIGDPYRIDVSTSSWWDTVGLDEKPVDYAPYIVTNVELLDANGNLVGRAGIEPKVDLQSAIKDAEAVETNKYTEDSVAALQNALAEAKALDEQVYPVPSKMQSAIDAIKDAISKLQSTAPTTADYTAVDAALAKIPSDLSGYTDESVTALNNAKNAVVRGLSADEQARVDGFATAIEEAIQKLEKKQDSSQQGPGNNDNKKPGVQNPSANDKVTAKDKAQKVMDQAKLKKLSVKSKAKKKITVKWKKVAGAKGYQVEVSKDKNFKQSKRVLRKNVKGKKLVIKKKLKSKKIYFVRVRAYATYKNNKGVTKKVYSKWNIKLRKVKVK